jgi:hypothetical protein
MDRNVIVAARLSRETFGSLDFEGKDPSDLLGTFEVNMNYLPLFSFREVDRIR